MLKSIRYTLAAICLAASVVCFILWLQSLHGNAALNIPVHQGHSIDLWSLGGLSEINIDQSRTNRVSGYARRLSPTEATETAVLVGKRIAAGGRFGETQRGFYFPLWYPALVFGLAAVAAMRIGRFTLRSALVGMSVVAALLGMVVAL